MTKDEIIMCADASGISLYGMGKDRVKFVHYLEAFANLIAKYEREACAKIVEESSLPDTYSQECLPEIANDIRTRGQE
jgi:hypothetical protein